MHLDNEMYEFSKWNISFKIDARVTGLWWLPTKMIYVDTFSSCENETLHACNKIKTLKCDSFMNKWKIKQHGVIYSENLIRIL
jgi:hypothetical protein